MSHSWYRYSTGKSGQRTPLSLPSRSPNMIAPRPENGFQLSLLILLVGGQGTQTLDPLIKSDAFLLLSQLKQDFSGVWFAIQYVALMRIVQFLHEFGCDCQFELVADAV